MHSFILSYIVSASVSSPIVSGGMRNIHENKVTSQLSGSSANHHADNSRHGSNEDYLQMVHRISSDVCNMHLFWLASIIQPSFPNYNLSISGINYGRA